MGLEGEGGSNAEISAAATAKRPEKIGLMGRVAHTELPVCGDDFSGNQVIASKAVFSIEDTDTAAHGDARNPDREAGSGRNGNPLCDQLIIDIGKLGPSTD